jgi:FtsP/CotA-like multicopper oxidase with cupredoxin domain
MEMTRRKFLRSLGTGSALLAATYLTPKRLFGQTKKESSFNPDLELELRAAEGKVQILPGAQTRVWTYQGRVLKGDPEAIGTLENTYLGPIIKVRKGQKVRIHFRNEIEDLSIIHWHGLHISEENDGHPRYVIPRGKTYVYEFTVKNPAGTYWYHPHPHRRTGPQVYYGLAGLLLVSDDEEAAAGLPSGAHEIPFVIQDRVFDQSNQLVYLPDGMMDQMTGFLGEEILVNGQRNFELRLSDSAYRFRILNGSNSRIYKLGWGDGTPLTVIGTDGGLLERPVRVPYVMMGPGERVDLWADFSGRKIGAELTVKSLSFNAGIMGGMMGGRGRGMMGGGQALPNGAEFPIFKVRIDRQEKTSYRLPERLSKIDRYKIQDAVNNRNPRDFSFSGQMMNWTINGRNFEMTNVAADEIVQLDTLEVWELINESGGMGMMGMMQMPHPIHIHGLQFQIVERSINRSFRDIWKTVSEGFVDEGLKDTVLLMPGMKVKIALKFEDYTGLFLLHCHNLEHEDLGMMRNYLVRA